MKPRMSSPLSALSARSASAAGLLLVQPLPGLYTAGQPAASDWAAIKARGVRTVVNLRAPGELKDRDEAAEVRAAGLRYVDDTQPGISRRRAGKGFSYRDADGHAIRDATTLQRIRALAIPPAYTAVWICAHANGHLQATGRDARGRKQYRYHPDWARERDAGKFDRIIAFGEALPTLRRRLSRDLKRPGFPKEKVLAMVVKVLIRCGEDSKPYM